MIESLAAYTLAAEVLLPLWMDNLSVAGFPTLLAPRDGLNVLLTNGYQSPESLQPLLECLLPWTDTAHA